MKKILFILLLCLGLFLVGCNKPIDNTKEFTFDNKVTEIKIAKDANKGGVSSHEIYVITEDKELDDFLNSLKQVTYVLKESKNNIETVNYSYVVIIKDSYHLLITSENNFVIYVNGFYRVCETVSGSFKFLDDISFGEQLIEVTLGYTINDFDMIKAFVFSTGMGYNLSSNHYIKNLLLETKYYVSDAENIKGEYAYILNISERFLMILYTDGSVEVCLDDNTIEYYKILNFNDFNFIKDISGKNDNSFSIKSINSVKVYNNEEILGEIKESEEFLNKLREIKYVKINNYNQFTLSEKRFKLVIEDKVIGIYDNGLIIINDDLYMITYGDFSFLKDVQFTSSSGWLPWV